VQIIEELMNQYQGYHPPQPPPPYMAPPPEYYVQSMEENPTSFVVC
jgi:hypothetical protein